MMLSDEGLYVHPHMKKVKEPPPQVIIYNIIKQKNMHYNFILYIIIYTCTHCKYILIMQLDKDEKMYFKKNKYYLSLGLLVLKKERK